MGMRRLESSDAKSASHAYLTFQTKLFITIIMCGLAIYTDDLSAFHAQELLGRRKNFRKLSSDFIHLP